jgi:RNA recognition motif-containing protein
MLKDKRLEETQGISRQNIRDNLFMFKSRKIKRRKNNRLAVSYLNYSVTNTLLEDLFSRHGKVINVRVNRDKGFGLIEMSSLREAEKAKKAFDGFDFEGRTLKVDKYYSPGHQNGNKMTLNKSRFKNGKRKNFSP